MKQDSRDFARNAEGEDVLFIVGAGRSGTTLLYKSLCLHPDIAWISNYLAKFPGSGFWPLLNRTTKLFPGFRRRAWFGANSNAYFNRRNVLLKTIPTPVEGEAVFSRCGIPVFPDPDWKISAQQVDCLRQTFDRIKRAQGAKLVMSKRTANNRRIPQLLNAFPEAKLLYIIRDGRATAVSMLRAPWWQDHKVWWLDGKTPRQWAYESKERNPLELAARNWVEEIKEIEKGLVSVPEQQIMHVRYEELIENAADIWSAVESFLDVSRCPEWIDEVSSLTLTDQNKNWMSTLSTEEKEILERVQSELLAQLGYI